METSEFWKGGFGQDYQERQKKSAVGSVESNIHMFERILWAWDKKDDVSSVLEIGAGTGQNIRALHRLFPEIQYKSIEINAEAAEQIPFGEVLIGDAAKIEWPDADLVLTKGLLIHLPEGLLQMIYHKIYKAAKKYILLCEYYNPTPVEVEYRGHSGKLWKRDFAGEILDRYRDLDLVDYGFVYHRDQYPQDDLTWFLLGKNNG